MNNHLNINSKGITYDGTPLQVEPESLVMLGHDVPEEPLRVMLTLIPDRVTIEAEEQDEFPEPTEADQHIERLQKTIKALSYQFPEDLTVLIDSGLLSREDMEAPR